MDGTHQFNLPLPATMSLHLCQGEYQQGSTREVFVYISIYVYVYELSIDLSYTIEAVAEAKMKYTEKADIERKDMASCNT
jgi:hypothetical protein